MAKPGMFISRIPSRATPRRASSSRIRCASATGAARVGAGLSTADALIGSSPPLARSERALPPISREGNRSGERLELVTFLAENRLGEPPQVATEDLFTLGLGQVGVEHLGQLGGVGGRGA